jgi:hypothetical protein
MYVQTLKNIEQITNVAWRRNVVMTNIIIDFHQENHGGAQFANNIQQIQKNV